MQIKYLFQFKFLNLDTSELRNLKIDSLNSDDILEFETVDVAPRIPSLGEIVKFLDRDFIVTKIDNRFQKSTDLVMNYIIVGVLDMEKEEERKIKLKMEEEKMKRKAAESERKMYEDLLRCKDRNYPTKSDNGYWGDLAGWRNRSNLDEKYQQQIYENNQNILSNGNLLDKSSLFDIGQKLFYDSFNGVSKMNK